MDEATVLFQFHFALATKLAYYMGKYRKHLKCQDIFDDIIQQGPVPVESTFYILTGAYLSSSSQGCLERACTTCNGMIQLGWYKPRLSLHNSLFKALVSNPRDSAKHNLNWICLSLFLDIWAWDTRGYILWFSLATKPSGCSRKRKNCITQSGDERSKFRRKQRCILFFVHAIIVYFDYLWLSLCVYC